MKNKAYLTISICSSLFSVCKQYFNYTVNLMCLLFLVFL